MNKFAIRSSLRKVSNLSKLAQVLWNYLVSQSNVFSLKYTPGFTDKAKA